MIALKLISLFITGGLAIAFVIYCIIVLLRIVNFEANYNNEKHQSAPAEGEHDSE